MGRGIRDKRAHASIEHSIRFDGDKFVSGQLIRCSVEGCVETHRFVTNNFSHRLPDDVIRRKGAQLGWRLKGTDWICPTHAFPRIVKPEPVLPIGTTPPFSAPIPKETPLPQTPIIQRHDQNPNVTTLKSFGDLANAAIEKMSRSDHRRIFAKIMENWDDNRARYSGEYGDQKVASELNVPRAWVEHIRKEAFGDSGDNEEIQELREDIEKHLSTFNLAADDALKLAGRVEELLKGMRGLLTRLEKVEKATGVRR